MEEREHREVLVMFFFDHLGSFMNELPKGLSWTDRRLGCQSKRENTNEDNSGSYMI